MVREAGGRILGDGGGVCSIHDPDPVLRHRTELRNLQHVPPGLLQGRRHRDGVTGGLHQCWGLPGVRFVDKHYTLQVKVRMYSYVTVSVCHTSMIKSLTDMVSECCFINFGACLLLLDVILTYLCYCMYINCSVQILLL